MYFVIDSVCPRSKWETRLDREGNSFPQLSHIHTWGSSSSSSSCLLSWDLATASRVDGRRTPDGRLSGSRIMFCWKRGEETGMAVGDSVAVGEIDALVTGNISILELWRNWAAVVGIFGLRGALECLPFWVEKKKTLMLGLQFGQNALGHIYIYIYMKHHSNCMLLWQQHTYTGYCGNSVVFGNTNCCFYSMVMSLWTTINMWSRWWVTLQELWLIWSLETICDLLSENPAHPAFWKNQVKATNHNSYLRSFHKRISKRLVVQLLRYSWKHTPHTRNYFLCKSILLRSSVLHVLYLNMFSTYIALAVQ